MNHAAKDQTNVPRRDAMNLLCDRRHFLKRSALAASAVTAAASFEERALLAAAPAGELAAPKPASPLPTGKIGGLSVTRLICGGNLISGFAHSRDLIYVSPLLKHYFTDAKVMETLRLCEQHGINTTILRVDDDTIRILSAYRKEFNSKIQWIAQVTLPSKDPDLDIKRAIDHGAVAVYVHGGVSDEVVETGRLEPLVRALEVARKNRVPGGIAGHAVAVPMACEKAGLQPDFFMKTLNAKNYWSAGPMPRLDSVWEETPRETIAFMTEVEKPWIAYKVLGAGAIHPRQGFAYAFENGADFVCVGMFDFQVAEDVQIAREAIARAKVRTRSWCI
jgi:hypothetical protein